MKLKNHFKEIIYNLYYVFFSFICTTIIIYYKKELFIKYIINLLNFDKISFFNITEAFWTFIHLSCTLSILCNIPFCGILIFLFSRPGLYKYQEQKGKRKMIWIFFLNIIIYTIIIIPIGIPIIINYFKNFETNNIEYIPTFLNLYIFNLKFSLLFLSSVNIPLLMPIIEKNYIKNRSKYILSILIMIAIITPPDIYSLIIIIVPIIIIIEGTLLFKKIWAY